MIQAPFDSADKRLLRWLASLTPREELVVRMALRGRYRISDRAWSARVDAPMKEAKINTTARMAKLRGCAVYRRENRHLEAMAGNR
jgi:hypothetical protein